MFRLHRVISMSMSFSEFFSYASEVDLATFSETVYLFTDLIKYINALIPWYKFYKLQSRNHVLIGREW